MANKMMNDRRRRVDPRQMVRTLGRVLRYVLKNYKFHCIAVLLCILGSALASVQGVLFTQSLIDDYIVPLTQSAEPDYGPLAAALVRVACIYAVGILCAYGYNRIMVNVSQGTMRIVKVFWALDAQLAYKRHFPAINWLNSYSLYLDSLKPWFDENLGPEFMQNREQAMSLLQSEASLNEIVQLVGKDSLSPNDQLTLESARMVREDFLQQNSFMDVASYSSYDRQAQLLAMILNYDKLCRAAIAKGAPTMELFGIPARERIGRAKSVPVEQYQQEYADIRVQMEREIDEVVEKAGDTL